MPDIFDVPPKIKQLPVFNDLVNKLLFKQRLVSATLTQRRKALL